MSGRRARCGLRPAVVALVVAVSTALAACGGDGGVDAPVAIPFTAAAPEDGARLDCESVDGSSTARLVVTGDWRADGVTSERCSAIGPSEARVVVDDSGRATTSLRTVRRLEREAVERGERPGYTRLTLLRQDDGSTLWIFEFDDGGTRVRSRNVFRPGWRLTYVAPVDAYDDGLATGLEDTFVVAPAPLRGGPPERVPPVYGPEPVPVRPPDTTLLRCTEGEDGSVVQVVLPDAFERTGARGDGLCAADGPGSATVVVEHTNAGGAGTDLRPHARWAERMVRRQTGVYEGYERRALQVSDDSVVWSYEVRAPIETGRRRIVVTQRYVQGWTVRYAAPERAYDDDVEAAVRLATSGLDPS